MVSPTISQPAAMPRPARSAYLLPMVLFCLGHYMVDLYSAALSVLQPLLLERFHLTYTQAGMLGATMVLSGSLLQPMYGFLADRFPSRLFSGLGPAVAGCFLSCLLLAPSYWWVLAMVAAGGAGIASFHPQGAARALIGVKENRGQAMAVFVSAGSLGVACGPIYFSFMLGHVLESNLAWAAVPGVLLSLVMLSLLPRVEAGHLGSRSIDWAELRRLRRPMTILFLLVVLRAVVQIIFTQFLPLYLRNERGFTLGAASLTLSAYLASGAIGGFAGGHLADRFGGRQVILWSMIGSVPLLALFVFGHGVASMVGLFAGGLVLLFTVPVNVVMAQDLAPGQAGTVSALMMGFAWGLAGLVFIPLAGRVADVWSMQAAFASLIAFPAIGSVLALRLPKK